MKHIEWTEEQKTTWAKWVKSRPECIQKMCASHPPDVIYKMKSTGQIVTLLSYFENGEIRVSVKEKYNPNTLFERNVFGVPIDDLELWDGKELNTDPGFEVTDSTNDN